MPRLPKYVHKHPQTHRHIDKQTRNLGARPYQLREPGLVHDGDVLQLDVQVLVDGVERARDGEIILQLHRHLLPHECLEKRKEKELAVGKREKGGWMVVSGGAVYACVSRYQWARRDRGQGAPPCEEGPTAKETIVNLGRQTPPITVG